MCLNLEYLYFGFYPFDSFSIDSKDKHIILWLIYYIQYLCSSLLINDASTDKFQEYGSYFRDTAWSSMEVWQISILSISEIESNVFFGHRNLSCEKSGAMQNIEA